MKWQEQSDSKSNVNGNRSCTNCKDFTPQFNKKYNGYVMTCNWNTNKLFECMTNNHKYWRKKDDT